MAIRFHMQMLILPDISVNEAAGSCLEKQATAIFKPTWTASP